MFKKIDNGKSSLYRKYKVSDDHIKMNILYSVLIKLKRGTKIENLSVEDRHIVKFNFKKLEPILKDYLNKNEVSYKLNMYDITRKWLDLINSKCNLTLNSKKMFYYMLTASIENVFEPFNSNYRINVYNTNKWRDLRLVILRKYDRCLCCGSKNNLSVDHILPVSLYPQHAFSENNLQVLCTSCNSSKGNRNILDYR